MAAPFATASDLATRLNVPVWTGSGLEQVNQHLADASEDLRTEIGWQVYPPVDVAVDVVESGRLPGHPIASITSVVDGSGATVPAGRYSFSGGVLSLYVHGPVMVAYRVGYEAPPADLRKWTCVVAAQSLARAADETLGATPSSEALAEYRISYSERQQLGDLPIPVRVLERLRSVYGQGVYVT